MFPYPSGQLHMGHVRVYSISDAMASYYKMLGYRVFHPMGWDGFGLPAENAAIQRSIKPQDWTKENISSMRTQLDQLGLHFDWENSEVATCSPSYYKWTQWIFLQLFNRGLAYQQQAVVNWDPVDQTVLADEQVDENGRSWRSGAKVEKRPLKQWFLRTTNFSKQLYNGLDDPTLEDWKDIVKIQKNWIGECDGVRFQYPLTTGGQSISVWTPDPLAAQFVPFIGIADSHILNLNENNCEDIIFSKHFNCEIKRLNVEAKNPFNLSQSLPIYVFPSDGFKFPNQSDAFLPSAELIELLKNELNVETAKSESNLKDVKSVLNYAREHQFGGHWTSSRLQDWLISRQRYWGTPIPIVHCQGECKKPVPVPLQDLPVELPRLDRLSTKGESPLLQATDWLNVKCPECGGTAIRETDTMDTFVDSAWYFLRYLDHK